MRKTSFFLLIFLFSFFGCDKTCTDSSACNYGLKEACKYSEYSEMLLEGTWNLIDIHDMSGNCIFSFSTAFNCELDEIFEWINLIFNKDKTCQVLTSPSDFSNPVPIGSWSLDTCQNRLNFSHIPSLDSLNYYSNSSIFGNQKIIELHSDMFLSEDLAGNLLHWEKI